MWVRSVLDIVAAEAARTVVGSSVGYFIGKVLGKREQQKRCFFLWDLEMDVSPQLIRKIIDQEVKDGCIKPDEADDRLAKLLEIRRKYGILGGFDTFTVATSKSVTTTVAPPTPQPAPSSVPSPQELAQKQLAIEAAKAAVGPPSALQKEPRKKFLGIL